MAHGEAGHGCADGETRRRPGADAAAPLPDDAVCDGGEGDVAGDERTAPPDLVPARECRTELHGWAGAHRHGAVRPRRRTSRRERPPRRWC
jgi:hypothetical protein